MVYGTRERVRERAGAEQIDADDDGDEPARAPPSASTPALSTQFV
jgi:hypothetical protein